MLRSASGLVAARDQTSLQIIRCRKSDDAMWNAFALASPRASFYHRAEWRQVNEDCFGHRSCYLAAVDRGGFRGVFPIVQVKSLLFGNIACSLPFVNYGGPCGDDDAVEAELLDAGARLAEEWKVDYLEIRSRRPMGQRYKCSTQKISWTVELDRDSERLFNAFRGDHRKDIRRAYKYGFTARFGTMELLDDFYTILSESWRDLGTPIYAKDYLKTVLTAFHDSTRICVVYASDGLPAAGALMGVQNGTVEGMWLGARAPYRRQLVGYVLYWEIIKDACEKGHRVFHLGRSTTDSGSEQFKKKWNATPAQLYWHYVLRTRSDIPRLNVRNRRFQLAISAWRRMPVWLTQRIGPLIARSIP